MKLQDTVIEEIRQNQVTCVVEGHRTNVRAEDRGISLSAPVINRFAVLAKLPDATLEVSHVGVSGGIQGKSLRAWHIITRAVR